MAAIVHVWLGIDGTVLSAFILFISAFCPSGWVEGQSKCFHVSPSTAGTSVDGAAEYCQGLNAVLPTPYTNEDKSILTGALTRNSNAKSLLPGPH